MASYKASLIGEPREFVMCISTLMRTETPPNYSMSGFSKTMDNVALFLAPDQNHEDSQFVERIQNAIRNAPPARNFTSYHLEFSKQSGEVKLHVNLNRQFVQEILGILPQAWIQFRGKVSFLLSGQDQPYFNLDDMALTQHHEPYCNMDYDQIFDLASVPMPMDDGNNGDGDHESEAEVPLLLRSAGGNPIQFRNLGDLQQIETLSVTLWIYDEAIELIWMEN